MLRYFSRILIITLILTAPLSFMGDKCPDFKTACDIAEGRRTVPAAVVVRKCADSRFPLPAAPGAIDISVAVSSSSASSTPSCRYHDLPLHERAPPVNTPAVP